MMETEKTVGRILDFQTPVDAVLVTDVQLSPDGFDVVYATTCASSDSDGFRDGTLWLVSAEGGPSRRLTNPDDGAARSPRWSPDGKKIAFLCEGKLSSAAQIYLLDLERGREPERLTDQVGGVFAAEWSPDGKRIAYTALDALNEPCCKEGQDEDVVGVAVRRACLWLLELPVDGGAPRRGELPRQRRLSPKGLSVGESSGKGLYIGGSSGFSWSSDGAEIVTTTTKSLSAHDAITPALVTLDMRGELRVILEFEAKGSGASPGPRPQFSPDGSSIAFNGAEGAFPAVFSLQTVALKDGCRRVLVPGYAGSFLAFTWLPGGRLVATVQEGLQGRLAIIDPHAGVMSDAIAPFDCPGGIAPLLSVGANGRRVAFVRATDTTCGDVFVAEIGGEARRLTDLNPWTSRYSFGAVSEITWTSFDGAEIQGLLILPVGYEQGRRYPTLLEIHGGPTSFWGHGLFFNFTCARWGHFLAQRGYAVLLPNPRGSAGRGTEFLRAIVGRPGEPDGNDLISGIDKVIDMGIADPERLVVGGNSWGGYLTNWVITHTNRFKAAASVSGISNWISYQGTTDIRAAFERYLGPLGERIDDYWRLSPIRYIGDVTTPTLIASGERDERVPPTQSYEWYSGLQACGVETQLVIYPREPHDIIERAHQIDLLQRVVDWFDRYVGRAYSSNEP